MFKTSKTVVLVESVEKAVKFYTEKLAFDLAEILIDDTAGHYVRRAEVRKGRCHIVFRTPEVEELAEFGMVKHCVGRGVAVRVELNKGLDKYHDRCRKKGVPVVGPLRLDMTGVRSFTVKDPFGMRVIFAEEQTDKAKGACGLPWQKGMKHEAQMETLVDFLRGLGFLKRVSQKFVRSCIKIMKKVGK